MKGFPAACLSVKANELHSLVIRDLASRFNNVFVLESSNDINGNFSDNVFVDIIHFTDQGRAQLAQSIYIQLKALGLLNL